MAWNGSQILAKSLNFVERVGNLLPHPASLFALMALGTVVLSGIMARLDLAVTHPGTGELIVPVSLLSFIWTFNAFNTIYLLTRGQPYIGFGEPGATDTLITYVFAVAFEYGHYGVAAAWSVLIFLMLIGFANLNPVGQPDGF